MKRTKLEKGITLVALVITIIVLLILAVVAIGAVRDSGVIGHAQNSADKYNTEKNKEESMLGDYESTISEYYSLDGDLGNMKPDGEGGDIVGDTEIEWAVDFDEEDGITEICITYIGDATELVLEQDKIINAYKIVYDPIIDDPVVSNEVISFKLSEVDRIHIYEDFVELNVESLKLGTVVKDKYIEFYEIKTLTILSGFGKVPEGLLAKDDSVETIIVEEGVTTIEYQAIYKPEKLKSITLPSTITTIEDNSLYGCKALENITINKPQGSIDLTNSGLTAEQISKVIWVK